MTAYYLLNRGDGHSVMSGNADEGNGPFQLAYAKNLHLADLETWRRDGCPDPRPRLYRFEAKKSVQDDRRWTYWRDAMWVVVDAGDVPAKVYHALESLKLAPLVDAGDSAREHLHALLALSGADNPGNEPALNIAKWLRAFGADALAIESVLDALASAVEGATTEESEVLDAILDAAGTTTEESK